MPVNATFQGGNPFSPNIPLVGPAQFPNTNTVGSSGGGTRGYDVNGIPITGDPAQVIGVGNQTPTTGLIGTIDPGTGKTVAQANTTTYDPTLRTVNPENETVSAQLDRILGKDSPYMQTARQSGADYANSRGLINSGMAGQAGEAAAISAALPIATSDANTYSNVAQNNAVFSNTAGQFNAGAGNTASLNAAAAANALGQTGAQGEQTRMTQAQGGDISARIAELQGQIQTGLTRVQGVETRLTAEQQAAAQRELTTLQGEQARTTQAAGIEGQKELAQQTAEFNTQLQVLKGNQALDLTGVESITKLLSQASAATSSVLGPAMQTYFAVMNDMAKNGISADDQQAFTNTFVSMSNSISQAISSFANIEPISVFTQAGP